MSIADEAPRREEREDSGEPLDPVEGQEPQCGPRGGARRLLRFLLGREIPARIVEAGGEGMAPRSDRRRPSGQADPPAQGELLRDLTLHQCIAADRSPGTGPRVPRASRSIGPGSHSPLPVGEGARRAGEGSCIRPRKSPCQRGQPPLHHKDEEDRRGGDEDLRTRQETQARHESAGRRRVPSRCKRAGAGSFSEAAAPHPPSGHPLPQGEGIKGDGRDCRAISPRRSADTKQRSARLSLSVSWPTSLGRGSNT